MKSMVCLGSECFVRCQEAKGSNEALMTECGEPDIYCFPAGEAGT